MVPSRQPLSNLLGFTVNVWLPEPELTPVAIQESLFVTVQLVFDVTLRFWLRAIPPKSIYVGEALNVIVGAAPLCVTLMVLVTVPL